MHKRLLLMGLLWVLIGLIGACQASPTGQSPASARTVLVYRPAT